MTRRARTTPRAPALDVPTRETLLFVERHLPSTSRQVLEVGCGNGRLAEVLAAKGFQVKAIDPDATAVHETRVRGIEAHRTGIQDFRGHGFDAVLFMRSLHHVVALDEGLARAADALGPGGTLIVEDFDLAAIDAATALWFYDTLAVLEIVDRVARVDDPLASLEPLARWQREHTEPPLHEGNRMRSAVAARFEVLHAERPPYLFRSAAARLPATPDAQAWVERLLVLESQRIKQGALRPVGLRLVARLRDRRQGAKP